MKYCCRGLFVFAAMSLLAASACSKFENDGLRPGEDENPVAVPVDTNIYCPGILRVKLTAGFAAKAESMADEKGMVVATKSSELFGEMPGVKYLRRTFPPAGRFEARQRKEGLHLWYDIIMDKDASVLTKSKALFEGSDGVSVVELIRKYKVDAVSIPAYSTAKVPYSNEYYYGRSTAATEVFNDPRLADQWHYYNDGSISHSVEGCDVNVVPVWRDIEKGNEKVIVSVVDGGIDIDHPDLKDNVWINEAELNGEEGVDDDGNGFVDDIYGWDFSTSEPIPDGEWGGDYGSPDIYATDHGTHVAGTIAAVNNNGIGVCGLAGGDFSAGEKGVKVMCCQVGNGTFVSNTPPAIVYGANNGAVISQNSWSGGEEESYWDAIRYFVKYAGMDEYGNQEGPMAGGIVIFAAGNDDKNTGVPAMMPEVVAVASVDAKYEKAWYSNFGDWIDVAAPGGDTNISTPTGVLSTMPMENGEYGYMQGTSMACPHISGIAALLVSHFGVDEPGFTPEKLRSKIENAGKDLNDYNPDYQDQLGLLVDTYASFVETTGTVPPSKIDDFEVTGASNRLSLHWSVPEDEDDEIASFTVYYSLSEFDSSFDRENMPEGMTSVLYRTPDCTAGEAMERVIERLEFEKTYYIAIDACDMAGNRSEMSDVEEVSTTENAAPVIESGDMEFVVRDGEEKRFVISYYDPDNHELAWYVRGGSIAMFGEDVEGETGKVAIVCRGNLAEPGDYEGSLSITDEYGASSVISIKYTVKDLQRPVVIAVMDNIILRPGGEPVSIDLNGYFADPDNDAMTFSARMADESVAGVTIDGNMMTVTPKDAVGSSEITVTATDETDMSASLRSNVVVTSPGASDFRVYPNPVVDVLNVSSLFDADVRIRLINPLGHVIADENVSIDSSVPWTFDLSGHAAGSYNVRIEQDGKTYNQRVVKL